MLVAVEDPKVLGPVSYGTIYSLPGDTTEKLNAFGAYRLQENQNPNVVPLYIGRDAKVVAKAGDTIKGRIVGVVDWEYSQPKIYTDDITQDKIVSSEKISDVTTLKSGDDNLTIASYNIENYSALRTGKNSTSDERSKRIA